jgi:hypothetical protein
MMGFAGSGYLEAESPVELNGGASNHDREGDGDTLASRFRLHRLDELAANAVSLQGRKKGELYCVDSSWPVVEVETTNRFAVGFHNQKMALGKNLSVMFLLEPVLLRQKAITISGGQFSITNFLLPGSKHQLFHEAVISLLLRSQRDVGPTPHPEL